MPPPPRDPLSLHTSIVVLVARIEAGEFIHMSELASDRVGISRPDDTGKTSTKCCNISGILEWIKCFSVYMAVISRKQPGRIYNLLAYEILIIEAHMKYSGDGWLGDDVWFLHCTATDTTNNWVIVDSTLWNLAFSGKDRATHCKFYFSLSHGSSDCAWATDQPTSRISTSSGTFSHPIWLCYT